MTITIGSCAIMFFNFIIDPFELNRHLFFELNRENVAGQGNNRLYKLIAYQKDPVPNIILGDSRMRSIDSSLVGEATGDRYFNFAYGGGSLQESIDTFWFSISRNSLKKVYIGINFNHYNQNNNPSLVLEARALIENSVNYYLSPYVAKIAVYCIVEKISNINFAEQIPRVSREKFWQYQLDLTSSWYKRYIYPVELNRQLKDIKKYCEANNIELVFIIPPSHVDLQNKVFEHRLNQEYIRFKEDLKEITTTIDFDYSNEWTENKNRFFDPYHFDKTIRQLMVSEIWKKQLKIGKIL